MSYTYLMTDGNNYKIGYTDRTPQQRVKELMSNSSTYYKITIDAYTEVLKGKQLEKRLHNHFNNKRIHAGREWFSLDIEDVAYIHNIFELEKLGECFAPFSKEGKRLAEIDAKQKEHKRRREEYNKNKEDQEVKQKELIKMHKHLEKQEFISEIYYHNGLISNVISTIIGIIAILYIINTGEPKTYFLMVFLGFTAVVFSLIIFRIIFNTISMIINYDTFKEEMYRISWEAIKILAFFIILGFLGAAKSMH